MNWRWYIPILTIALAFFATSREQATLPNQEIVVQFGANAVSDEDAQRAVAEITNQLEAIGVAEIQVSQLLHGKLKVTYYSTIDVAVIKNLFYKQNKINLDEALFAKRNHSPESPFGDDHSKTYRLDVIQIQKNYGSDFGFHGLPVELKSAKDQYLNQVISLVNDTHFGFKQNFESVAYKNYRTIALLIDTSSHKIPEVRAGPVS
ncbi:hypothetical protein QRD02_13880 [Aequorivita sp. SDUM287046]|uniref:DUF541 domain-containing protein n=1 Tax=Aequorivita aurantiaca TaxID=3053356 RepID=A0ABT8DKV2_9FLAO|nr:hypothetical protein [Aequorivita aurantiaca]MDN3725474.1 hypothetical protein [Aequorivita aurantiaca]